MTPSIIEFLRDFLPDNNRNNPETPTNKPVSQNPSEATPGKNVYNRQYLLDQIVDKFKKSIDDQSTTVSMLFDGFFRVIISEDLKNTYQPTFQSTVNDAMKEFCRAINERRKEYSNFRMPLNHCRFELNIQPAANMRRAFGEDCDVAVESFFVDPNDIDRAEASAGTQRVMTVINKNGQVKNRAINSSLLNAVTEINTHMFEAIFNLADPEAIEPTSKKEEKKEVAKAKQDEETPAVPTLTLTADNFFFLKGQKEVTTFKMESDRLKVGGRNAAQQIDGIPVLRCDSDEIMNPHFEIRRSGNTFYLNPEKEVEVNGKNIAAKSYFELPNSATVKLNKKYEIKIAIKD